MVAIVVRMFIKRVRVLVRQEDTAGIRYAVEMKLHRLAHQIVEQLQDIVEIRYAAEVKQQRHVHRIAVLQ